MFTQTSINTRRRRARARRARWHPGRSHSWWSHKNHNTRSREPRTAVSRSWCLRVQHVQWRDRCRHSTRVLTRQGLWLAEKAYARNYTHIPAELAKLADRAFEPRRRLAIWQCFYSERVRKNGRCYMSWIILFIPPCQQLVPSSLFSRHPHLAFMVTHSARDVQAAAPRDSPDSRRRKANRTSPSRPSDPVAPYGGGIAGRPA